MAAPRSPSTGHGFFKDFTIKDGNIIENHGGHGEMSTEVKVHQVVWLADTGKILPRAYSFTIKTRRQRTVGQEPGIVDRDRPRLAAHLVAAVA